MSFSPQQLVPWLDALASAATEAQAFLPAAGKPVAEIIVVVLRFASDLAKVGINPSDHIERIHAADANLQGIENSWAKELQDKFKA